VHRPARRATVRFGPDPVPGQVRRQGGITARRARALGAADGIGHNAAQLRREDGMTIVGGVLWWIVLGALAGWLAAWWLGRSAQRLLAEPVIQIVERVLDNPRHIARIASLEGEVARMRDLEAQAATIPALQARVDELLAAPPRVVEKVVTRTVDRVVEKPVERVVEKVVERLVDRPVPDTAAMEARDAALRGQRQRLEHLEALAAVLRDRVARAGSSADVPSAATTPAAVPAAAAVPPAVPPAVPTPYDTVRSLRTRIEHLEALAAVQADRLAQARGSALNMENSA
jgi:hypothetical protein